jgi:hypothetical protein
MVAANLPTSIKQDVDTVALQLIGRLEQTIPHLSQRHACVRLQIERTEGTNRRAQ